MSKAIVEVVARYSAGTIALAIGAAWTSPIWERPEVQALGVAGAQGLTAITVTAAGVLAVGFAWHKLAGWYVARPPSLDKVTLPKRFSYSADARRLAFEETQQEDEPDYEDGWEAAVTKFALIGNMEGFGWRSMCRFVGREGWAEIVRLMIGAEVLTPPRGQRPAEWSGAWSYCKFRLALKHGRLGLTYPPTAPPVVVWEKAYRHAIARKERTQRTQRTQYIT